MDCPSNDYDYQIVSEDACRNSCLSDCFCALAVFRDGKCWKKKQSLSNGFVNPSILGKGHIKFRNNTTVSPSGTNLVKKDHSIMSRNGALLFGSSVLMNFMPLLAIVMVISRLMQKKVKKASNRLSHASNLPINAWDEPMEFHLQGARRSNIWIQGNIGQWCFCNSVQMCPNSR